MLVQCSALSVVILGHFISSGSLSMGVMEDIRRVICFLLSEEIKPVKILYRMQKQCMDVVSLSENKIY